MSRDFTGNVSRRKFLAGSSAAGAIFVAGCAENTADSGNGNGNGGNGNGGNGNGGNGNGGNGNGGNGNGGNGNDQLSGEIIVKGSSTVFPVSQAMAELFMEEHPQVNVTTDSTGSGGGFKNWFCPGDSDLNGASRPITGEEEDQCSSNEVSPVEFRIAGDALTVAVNNDADWVDCVTPDELSQIWRDDGAERWSDVRDEWPDEEFALFGPASTSGTYDWFNNNVIGEDNPHTDEHQPTEEDETIVAGISDNEAGMGYFGYAYYNANPEEVKALEIDGGNGCTEPSLEGAKSGDYPLARPLFIYVAEEALQREEVYQFMKFYLENTSEDFIADEIGYVPSNEDQVEENLNKLDEMAGR